MTPNRRESTAPTRRGARRSPRRSAPRRSRWWLWLLGGLLVAAVALALLAWPMRGVRSDALNAKSELTVSVEALKSGNLKVARAHQRSAQRYVDRVTTATDGLGARVWSWVPIAGGGVRDVRHLAAALDDGSQALKAGIGLYPAVMDSNDGLVQGQNVDLDKLRSVLDQATSLGDLLLSARDELEQVQGDAPFIGASIGAARDDALGKVEGPAAAYVRFQPAIATLPRVLGADGERSYLVMFMNPSELRYSGGAVLSGAPVTVNDGKIRIDQTRSLTDLEKTVGLKWPKVSGNRFHDHGATMNLQNATLNPNWSVSAEEFLRGFKVASGRDYDGLIVMDVQAVARMLAVTSPLQTKGYGELNADNLVPTLAGSYDTYTDYAERRALNDELGPLFAQRIFDGGEFVPKFRAIGEAASAREFAAYFRDPAAETMVRELGADGDLSAERGDYVGVFSQNTNISKVDYYQRRQIRSEVELREDGSAKVRLTAQVVNDTPPYLGPAPDPESGSYQTRWAGLSLATFLPDGAEVNAVAVDGKVNEDVHVGTLINRPYVRRNLTLAPGATGEMTVDYEVPAAAVVDGDTLTYAFSADPQALANPVNLDVRVQVPEGYSPQPLPDGWTFRGGALRFQSADWASSLRVEIPLTR